MHAAVLGHPVSHSLSPALHTAAYRAAGLVGWSYSAIDCLADRLPEVLADVGPDCAGFSVTMPLKRVALQHAGSASAAARVVGAANTLLPRDGGWLADNTDVAGIVDALTERGVRADAGPVLLLGAGGAAQAALVALRRLGVAEVVAGVRSAERAAELRDTAERVGLALGVVGLAELAEVGERDSRWPGLVVSALPAHAADALAVRGTALLDMVYEPWPTALAERFAGAGATVVSGHDMLVHQAAHQFELMTGCYPQVAAMRAVLPTSR